MILVYPIPEQGWDIPSRLAKQLLFNSKDTISVKYNVVSKRNYEVINNFDGIGYRENLVRIYPMRILCNTYQEDRCISALNGAPLYYDDDHLSNVGAKLIVNEVMRQLK